MELTLESIRACPPHLPVGPLPILEVAVDYGLEAQAAVLSNGHDGGGIPGLHDAGTQVDAHFSDRVVVGVCHLHLLAHGAQLSQLGTLHPVHVLGGAVAATMGFSMPADPCSPEQDWSSCNF